MVTSDQLCINYALKSARVKELSALISKGICTRTAQYLRDLEAAKFLPDGHPVECLTELFADPGLGEDGDQICDICREKLHLIKERKIARQKLGATKRAVFIRGKMLKRAMLVITKRASVYPLLIT